MRFWLMVCVLSLPAITASADAIDGEPWEDSDCPSGQREALSHEDSQCVPPSGLCSVDPTSPHAAWPWLLGGAVVTLTLRRRRE